LTGLIAILLSACFPLNDIDRADESDVSLQKIDNSQV